MAIRIRWINRRVVALCAAKTKPEPGDLYFDDVVDSALRKKFLEDYKKEGLIEVQAEPSEAELEEFVEKHYEKIRQAIGKSMFTLPIHLLNEMLSEYDKLRRG